MPMWLQRRLSVRLWRCVVFIHGVASELMRFLGRWRPGRRVLACPELSLTIITYNLPVCRTRYYCQNPFRYPRQMDGLQSVLSSLPTVGVYVVGAAAVAALGLTGSSAVAAVAPEGVKSFGKVFGGMIGAAVGGFVALQLKQKRESAAIIELSNILVEMGDPTALTREVVAGVEAKYGIQLCVSCLEEMKSLYGTFVEAAIPAGAAPLSGSEQVLIQNFKNALGLTDEEAAPVHIDVGRRVLRGRLESSSRGEDFEARKTFQKLIYVSSLVFGERKAAFLLPWSRVFGLTDAQVQVARKDNAVKLFEARIATTGLTADESMLKSLKEYQAQVRLADEEAVDVIVAAEQKVMEGLLDSAIETVKKRARGKDYGPVLEACKEAIEYNKSMEALKGREGIPSGVGAVSLTGTDWESAEGRNKDLREVFRYDSCCVFRVLVVASELLRFKWLGVPVVPRKCDPLDDSPKPG